LADGRFAMVFKTHHCVVDGVSAADILSVMMDAGREPLTASPLVREPNRERAEDRPRAELQSPAGVDSSLGSALMDPEGLPAKIVGGARALAAFAAGTLDFAPPSSLNAAIGPRRMFETVLADLDCFKAIKNSLGGTINDAVLSVVAGGLGHLLKSRGECRGA
jgi:diacylglycerol O-acyltransferase / wax synthase